jgi:uridine phosphorylase
MGIRDAVIAPTPGKHPASIGARCAMVGNPLDVDELCSLAGLTPKNSRGLLLSRLYHASDFEPGFSVIGPFIGAPYASMLLESVIAWGVREIVFFGWCGAVSPEIHVGDIIVPDLAIIDEGTSRNYAIQQGDEARPSLMIQNRLKEKLIGKKIGFIEGSVWSTDAIFRETPEKIAYYLKREALGVEMEASALFSVGLFRNIPVGCLLVVSDEVSTGQWVRGFANPKFKQSRRLACEAVRDTLMNNPPMES